MAARWPRAWPCSAPARTRPSPGPPASIAARPARPWSCVISNPRTDIMLEAERLHGHLIGQQGSRRSLNTPALVLDLEMLDRNIAEMASFAKAHNVKLRPHSKTHKSADIAKRQIAAGALGVCCAKLGEAEALAEGGVESAHITSPVGTPQAIVRLIALNAKARDVMGAVDHPAKVDALAAAAAKA